LSSVAWPATALFPLQHKKALHEAILDEILEERVVSSRNRINPRGVKRKMSSYKLRPRERHPTQCLDVSKQIRIIK
jgi:benzoyl-CoA reductase/2-hydroxyglutaryl-CoA dehydratase subunit BcrC/BadD/HgdB